MSKETKSSPAERVESQHDVHSSSLTPRESQDNRVDLETDRRRERAKFLREKNKSRGLRRR